MGAPTEHTTSTDWYAPEQLPAEETYPPSPLTHTTTSEPSEPVAR